MAFNAPVGLATAACLKACLNIIEVVSRRMIEEMKTKKVLCDGADADLWGGLRLGAASAGTIQRYLIT